MKYLSLMSTGIDSPVTTYLVSKKASEIIVVHIETKPLTGDKEREKLKKIVDHLKKNTSTAYKTYLVPNSENLVFFKKKCKDRYTCVFCKRMMLRLAEKIAEKEKAQALIMGDSLGQVASQTLQNLKVIDPVTKMPIFRPLIGLDKEEIVRIAKKIGTYNYSIENAEPCPFVPKKPATKTILKNIIQEENKINIKNMIKESIKNSEIIQS